MIDNFIAEQTEAGLDFEIDLNKNKRVYCFIGDNAVGKTNLLENLARSLLYCHSIFQTSTINDKIYEVINSKVLRLATGDIFLNKIRIKDKIHHDITIDKPIVFIGAKNRGYTKNIDKNHITILGDKYDRFLQAFLRSFNYMNGSSVENTEIADWFNSRLIINPNFVPQNQNLVYEVEAVLKLMQKLEPSLDLTIGKIQFYEGKLYIDSIPLDKLSTGFVSIIKLFQDIIAAYGGWSGLVDDKNLNNIEGMVFIDEIESHIHPKWQYRIIPLLKESFPKTTFYIATHSPVIISMTDEGEAYELIKEGKKVTANSLGNPKEWYLNDVFVEAFHINLSKSTFVSENESNSLIQMLKSFNIKVTTYVNTKDESLKQEAEILYQKIIPSLTNNDPRRRSLDSLRSLLQ